MIRPMWSRTLFVITQAASLHRAISCRTVRLGIRSRSGSGLARSAPAHPVREDRKPETARRDELHRGFVVRTRAYRQTRKPQRNTAGNSLHARIERLVLPHECLSVDSGGGRGRFDWWASAAVDQGIRRYVETSHDGARVLNRFDSVSVRPLVLHRRQVPRSGHRQTPSRWVDAV